jgi:hypothetical protein
MNRMHRLAAALSTALISGAIGCAHCDTCDEFPRPCVGSDCAGLATGGELMPTSAPIAAAPMGLMGEGMPYDVTDVPAGTPMPSMTPAPAPTSAAPSAAPSVTPPPPIPGAAPAAAPVTTPPALPPALPAAPPVDSPPLASPVPSVPAP